MINPWDEAAGDYGALTAIDTKGERPSVVVWIPGSKWTLMSLADARDLAAQIVDQSCRSEIAAGELKQREEI